MKKIIFNSRDELICLDVDMIAAVQADGNYSRIIYINKHEINITRGISEIEERLKKHNSKKNRFIRLGRSILINHVFLEKIDLQRQTLILTDCGTNEIRINLSKKILKPYKKAVIESTKIKNSNIENSEMKVNGDKKDQ